MTQKVKISHCQVDIDNVDLERRVDFLSCTDYFDFYFVRKPLAIQEKWNLDIFCIPFFRLLYFWLEFARREIYSVLTDRGLLDPEIL